MTIRIINATGLCWLVYIDGVCYPAMAREQFRHYRDLSIKTGQIEFTL